MFAYTAEQVTGSSTVRYQGVELNLAPPWEQLSIREAVQEYLEFDYMDYPSRETLYDYLQSRQLADGLDRGDTWGRMIVEHLLGNHIERHLIQPTIIKDYPRDVSPFAKRIKSAAVARRRKGASL